MFLAVGNTPPNGIRKTPYLPNHICYASAVYLGRKPTFATIFLARPKNKIDAFFNPKNASEMNARNNTPPTRKAYEFSSHRCCLTFNFGNNVNQSHEWKVTPWTINTTMVDRFGNRRKEKSTAVSISRYCQRQETRGNLSIYIYIHIVGGNRLLEVSIDRYCRRKSIDIYCQRQ